MRSRDEQREEQRRYEGDVWYDVWRGGGNPDRVDHDRVIDGYYEGRQAEDVARSELRRQRPPPVRSEAPTEKCSYVPPYWINRSLNF